MIESRKMNTALPTAEAARATLHAPSLILDYPQAELVFGIVCAVGTDYRPVQNFLEDQIQLCGYRPNVIRISDFLPEMAETLDLTLDFPTTGEYARINKRMDAGNAIRRATERSDILALAAAAKIHSTRNGIEGNEPEAHIRTAHVLISLKRPEEVATLRKIYGAGFYLVGIFAGEQERRDFLKYQKGIAPQDIAALVERDQNERDDYGQRTRKTFELADVFVASQADQFRTGLRRFIRLVFGDPFATPMRDELAMFFAYSAALRSSSLARQVGAAILSSAGDLIAVGCNDVPRPGGGLYWDEEPDDKRDHKLGCDSNDVRKQQIIDNAAREFRDEFIPEMEDTELLQRARKALRRSSVSDITEYGRAVHAEMDALLTAGRCGVSCVKGTLYTTTFPCHNCSRHIVASGIDRVVYIEPYPKSLARDLHSDAIRLMGDDPPAVDGGQDKRIPFEPFLGIGPRRFFDLFSLKLSAGYSIERKANGTIIEWDPQQHAKPRVPMAPTSYLEREQRVTQKLGSVYETVKARRKNAREG